MDLWDLCEVIIEGVVDCVCLKMMIVVVIMVGLLFIMWSSGIGLEVMC